MKQPTDSSTATAVGASASSKRKPDPASSFPALIVALQHSLKDALSNLASASSQDGRVVPIRPLVLFSSGPSLLMPKCVLGLRLPSLENDLNTEEGQRTRDPGLLERATLREFFKKELGNSIARTQTTVLLLAPRSFSQPGWLPRTNISHRLSSLVADEEPVSSSIPTRCKPLPKLIVERFAVTLTQQGVATGNRLEVSEQDDIQTGIEGDSRDWVWFMWEGGVVEGWKG
ncbi:hypothetical protein [Phaffia rhodozyma]|uniref:Uncharacterized protein n=1 Tax=Phaffia rhodozyma TaxID=264483 RepID=A0A0F7SSY3_PHARH|nr:hypothetical protein [Phaffia rhodozyma]